MNQLKEIFPQGGNGIYGWDLVNPYLQEMYRNKGEDDEEDSLPSYIAPLPGENSQPQPAEPKYEPEIPLQPNYPINPDPTDEEPRKLQSFTEGLNLAGKRIWNDLKYSRGYIQDKFSDDEMSDAANSALEHIPEYQGSSEEQLQHKEDSLKNESEQPSADQPRIELKGLQEYRNLRNKGLTTDEINRRLSETVQWGNEGRRIMEEARSANNAFPETEGWASVGKFAADIGRVGIPVALGAISAPLGIAAGVANVSSSVAESYAQAQMELDNFEEETGKKLSQAQRIGYTAVCIGADFLFDTILQSRYLKNLKSGAKKQASDYFKKHIIKNEMAQSEIKQLMNRLSQTDKSGIITGSLNDALLGGSAEALNSVAHDLAQTIYNEPENYPTLESILKNATSSMIMGGITGGVVGSAGRAVNLRRQNARRNKQETTSVINHNGFTYEVLDYNPETQTATLLSPDGKRTMQIEDVDPDMIRTYSPQEYRKTERITKEIDEPDLFGPVTLDLEKEFAWLKMSTRGKYRMVKDLADRMGLDNVIIYEHESDLPPSILAQKRGGGKIGGYHTENNGDIGIVLDNVPSYAQVQRVLLHEAVGHRGLDALFGDSYFRDEFLLNVYRSMPSTWKLSGPSWEGRQRDAEEYLASLASEGIHTSAWASISSELKDLLRIFYPGLKFSERELRQFLVRAKDALKRDDSIYEMNRKLRNQQLYEKDEIGRPLIEIDNETYRNLWENDPEWQRYKRFYDEVYGKEANTGTDINSGKDTGGQ